jgi:hypothetical protein
MRRTYFFDRDHFRGIILSFGDSIPINIDDIPQPSVNMCNNEAIVTCPYWNDWKGLVLESVRVAFKDDGKIKFDIVNSRALYKYDCGICF